MGSIWTQVVGAVHALLTLLAAASGGSVGLAIVSVSLALRLALLPLTIRVARRAEEQRRLLETLRPQLERLKRRYAKQPHVLSTETLALYREHGVRPLDGTAFTALLLQLPLMSALYSAIQRGLGVGQRFLWITDLAKPDVLLVIATGVLTFVASYFGPGKEARSAISVLSVVLTVAIMWRVSAALGLYWASSTAVGALQSVWLRNRRD